MQLLPYEKSNCKNFPDNLEVKLFKVFLELNKAFGATYMSYTFDLCNTKRYSFRTDSLWSTIYQTEAINGKPLIQLCPLDIASRQKNNMYILWDIYGHKLQPKTFREIMGMREDIGLMH